MDRSERPPPATPVDQRAPIPKMPSAIRAELLEQHQRIRAVLATANEVALRARAGAEVAEELRANLVGLTDLVRTHNLREEDLLRKVSFPPDASGSTVLAHMTQEHVQEHDRLFQALFGLAHTSSAIAGVGVVALLALIREHLEREEATFLSDAVLRDDPAPAR